MATRLIDLTGQSFGRLTVLERVEDMVSLHPGSDEKRFVRWRCLCDCGNVVDVLGLNLRQGQTRSCGCLRRETSRINGQIRQKQRRAQNLSHTLGL